MTSSINKELGRRVRAFREHRNLALEELASIARIPWAVLEDIESGRHFPSLGQIERLLVALNVTWQELTAEFMGH